MRYLIALVLLIGMILYPCMAEETYTVTFTGMDNGAIKVTYKEAGATGASTISLPADNPYNKMITEYLAKFKLFN